MNRPTVKELQHQSNQRGGQPYSGGRHTGHEATHPFAGAQLAGQPTALQVGPEAVVEEVGELLRVPGDRVDELGDLVDEE